MITFKLPTSGGHHISCNDGSIYQIPFLSHAHRFPHHRLQVLLYLPPVQVWLSESLAKHANMGKASLYHLLVVSSLWLPVFLHQCSGKVIMGIGVNPNKAFQLLTRNFREYLIYLVKICICVHCKLQSFKYSEKIFLT